MAFKCTVPGCEDSEKEFKTETALKSHIRNAHPEEKPGGGAREVPIVEEDFTTLLQKFKIKGDLAANIAENVSITGGPKVFEEPELLLKRLTTWSSDILPGKRKNIIEQWFASKGIDISPEVQLKAGMTTDQISKVDTVTKTSGEVKYVWDTESRQIRMAKEGERGGTLAQAKELKKMADEDEKAGTQSPFMQDAEGHWILNPKARVSGVELMAVQFMQQAQQKGEPVDPITAMTRAAETWKTLREGLGGGAGALPAWMTDPLAFVQAIKTISGDTGGDSALKETLATMQKTMDELKEQRWKDQFAVQQKQIQDLANMLKQTSDTMADLKKGSTGRTEMDIIHDIATGGMDFLKVELPGMRRDIRDALGSTGLPPGKTDEERDKRKQRVRGALETDKDIADLGQRIFFPQG